ncbi:hypothetical protein T07_8284, partial [Trichinella nelsoni]
LMKNALATALGNLPNSVASLQQITSINSKFIPPYVSLIPHHQQSCYQDFCVIPNNAAKTELNDR